MFATFKRRKGRTLNIKCLLKECDHMFIICKIYTNSNTTHSWEVPEVLVFSSILKYICNPAIWSSNKNINELSCSLKSTKATNQKLHHSQYISVWSKHNTFSPRQNHPIPKNPYHIHFVNLFWAISNQTSRAKNCKSLFHNTIRTGISNFLVHFLLIFLHLPLARTSRAGYYTYTITKINYKIGHIYQ